MRKKIVIAVLVAAALGSTALVGCGNDESATSDISTTESESGSATREMSAWKEIKVKEKRSVAPLQKSARSESFFVFIFILYSIRPFLSSPFTDQN